MNLKSFYDTNKAAIKTIGVIILITIVAYVFIQRVFIQPKNDLIEYKKEIIEQVRDSIIIPYKDSIKILQSENAILLNDVDSLKKLDNGYPVKETIIRNIYNERIKYIEKYSTDDITQYFLNRYGSDTIQSDNK